MAEIGIDIASHRSKSVDEFLAMELDCVVALCDQARQTCPFFPGVNNRFIRLSTIQLPSADVRKKTERSSGG